MSQRVTGNMEPRGDRAPGVEDGLPERKAVKDAGELGSDGPLGEGGCHHLQVVPSRDWHLATFFERVRNLPLDYTYCKILRNLGNEIAVSLSVTLQKVSCRRKG